MKQYFDVESGSVISEKDLQAEFNTLAAAGDTECRNFAEYIRACTSKHGSLVSIVDTKKEVIL